MRRFFCTKSGNLVNIQKKNVTKNNFSVVKQKMKSHLRAHLKFKNMPLYITIILLQFLWHRKGNQDHLWRHNMIVKIRSSILLFEKRYQWLGKLIRHIRVATLIPLIRVAPLIHTCFGRQSDMFLFCESTFFTRDCSARPRHVGRAGAATHGQMDGAYN